jgi:hypothetical protein
MSLSAQATLERLEEDITRGGGIYHSYEFVEIEDVKAPKGFKPFYISHYGRHGSRYHFLDYFFGTLRPVLNHADSLDNLTPDGKLLLSQVDSILAAHHLMLGNLTDRGKREQKLLAERMSNRFPEVFSDKTRNQVEAYSSIVRRCIMSMATATARLTQLNPTIDLRLRSDDIVYQYLSLGKKSRETSKYFDPFMNEALQKSFDWSNISARVFKDPSKAIGTPFELGHDIWNFWSICQCIETVHIDILKYFTLEEFYQSYRIRSGYAYLKHVRSDVYGEANANESVPLLVDFVEKADEAIAGGKVAATLRYGHDATLMPLAAMMGLEDFSKTHSMDNLPVNYWDLGSKIGMASNLQMVFYKNKKGDVIVKFLYNERETTVPALEPVYGKYYYSWDSLRKFYAEKMK